MTDTVAPMLDAGGTRVVAYLLVAALAATWYARERRAATHTDPGARGDRWPSYWLLTTLVLLAMGIGRGVFADTVAELGREQAWSSWWYGDRRAIQIATCALICGLWIVAAVVAVGRVRSRRRRYLTSMASILLLTAFVALRVVSLHHIDTVLYRRDIGGVRYVAIIELGLLAFAALAIVFVRIAPPASEPAVAPPGRFTTVGHGDPT